MLNNEYLPSPSVKLVDVIFEGDFGKLVKRVLNVKQNNYSSFEGLETIQDLLELSEGDLWSAQGVGKRYITIWRKLKNSYAQYEEEAVHGEALEKEKKGLNPEFQEAPIEDKYSFLIGANLNYAFLTKKEIKCMDKLKSQGVYKDALSVLLIDTALVSSAGEGFRVSLLSIQEKVRNFAESYVSGTEDDNNVVVLKETMLELEDIDLLLAKDVERFLGCIPESNQEIFQKRWGFIEPKETLESVSKSYAVTRERIRQIAKKDNAFLLNCLSSRPEDIREMVLKSIDSNLSKSFPLMSSCFHSEGDFISFLEHVCNIVDLDKVIWPEVPLDILIPYFQLGGKYLSFDDVAEILDGFLSSLDSEYVFVKNIISYLEGQGVIVVNDGFISPRLLSKPQAAACLLAEHEHGLPWLDLAKIANHSGICKARFSEKRRENAALDDLEYIYLSGKGVYRHVKFIKETEEEMQHIVRMIERIISASERTAYNLLEIYRDHEIVSAHDYYVVRHAIKAYGERFGVFFNGKSQADTVSIGKKQEGINQESVIIEVMKNGGKALTKAEIAGLIKSKSLGHASFYLEKMVAEGSLVQVDRMVYTTPEIAFSDIDIIRYEAGLESVMRQERRPVDPSWFQKILNPLFNESRSKYFYCALAKYLSITNAWHRRHNLFSIDEIPFRNLGAILEVVCDLSLPSHQNIIRIKEKVAITDKSAEEALYRWRRNCGA